MYFTDFEWFFCCILLPMLLCCKFVIGENHALFGVTFLSLKLDGVKKMPFASRPLWPLTAAQPQSCCHSGYRKASKYWPGQGVHRGRTRIWILRSYHTRKSQDVFSKQQEWKKSKTNLAFIVSVLGQEEGYKVKYTPSPEADLEGKTEGSPEGEGVY